MLILAVFLFLIAALFGFFILTAILQDRPTTKRSVLIHGAFAVSALVLVIIYMLIAGSPPELIISLVLFIIAALGGLTLYSIDLKKKKIPKVLALLHPVIAIAGLIVLIMYVLP